MQISYLGAVFLRKPWIWLAAQVCAFGKRERVWFCWLGLFSSLTWCLIAPLYAYEI
jgi:hypothetical protein